MRVDVDGSVSGEESNRAAGPALSRRALLGGGLASGLAFAAGCSKGSGSGSSGSAAGFSYRIPDEYFQWIQDDKWYPALTKAANARINLVDGGPRSSYYNKIDLAITSRSVKDAMIVNLSQVANYGPQGAFMDLKPLIDQHAPNIKRYLDDNPEYAQLVTFNGKVFCLVNGYPKISSVTFYRDDMFKKAGISKPPATISEFTNVLRTLKKTYSGVKTYYPLLGRASGLGPGEAETFVSLQYAFNAQDRVAKDGTLHGIYNGGLGLDIYSPGFKQMLQWYRSLYVEELIDPEYVAGTITEDAWQTKMLTGKGAISTDFFTRPSWFVNAGGKDNDPNYSIKVMPAFSDANGAQLKVPGNPPFQTEQCLVIDAKSENAEAIIKFLDFTFSPKGQTIMHYGVDQKSYTQKDGKPSYIVSATKESNQPVGTPVWNFDQDRLTFPAPIDNNAYYKWWATDKITSSFDLTYFEKYTYQEPVIRYSPDQLKQRTNLEADLETYIAAQIVAFVTGKRAMSEVGSFLSEATAKGAKKVTAIDQAAYDAMFKR
jgi:putative aldouronate transport system substrate-binding protein